MNIQFLQIYDSYYLFLEDEKKGKSVRIDFPAVVCLLGGKNIRVRYNTVTQNELGYTGEADIIVRKDYRLHLMDTWYQSKDGSICLDRKMVCTESDKNEGIRVTTEFRICDEMAESFNDYQLIVPGAFYNKNDTDQDGMDDYLGTYNQDYKDDRNPGLSETAWCRKSKNYFTLIRADIPGEDRSVTRQQLDARHFIHQTDIGSLGFMPSPYRTKEMILRCDYPFYERNSFCLNIDASEWSAYREMKKGDSFRVSYILRTSEAESLTDAGWQVSVYQMNRILNDNIKLPFTLQESMDYRRELTHNSYREFPDKQGNPAGYFVHFSPRESYGVQNILEYGFSGQQQMLSYVMLRAARELKSEEHKRRALKTLKFFIDTCIHESGIPYGLYDVDKEEFIFWWTGVLFPFQYSHSRSELERYLGRQVVSAILPIAEELKKNNGNYTRTMVDSIYYLWLCYEEEKKDGVLHDDWKTAVMKFCDTFVSLQNTDGSWNRAYTMDGRPLIKPVEWFGCNDLERGSGAIFPIEVIARIYKETKDEKYLKSCKRAADFIYNNYVQDIKYTGGLNDTTHKKSIKIDAVGVMFAMRSLLLTYEMCGEKKYLEAAAEAAKVLSTWTYLWNIPFDKSTLLGRHGFQTTGWAGCDVIPACSYVDNEFAEFVPDVLRIVEYSKDLHLARLAKIVFLGMQHGMSTPMDMYEYKMSGVQCEGFMTSLWLSDTENPEFSGAVAKMKGDDNDTCNGLINGQQLATMHELRDRYNTMDMEEIINSILHTL